jgi:hypothetical protein
MSGITVRSIIQRTVIDEGDHYFEIFSGKKSAKFGGFFVFTDTGVAGCLIEPSYNRFLECRNIATHPESNIKANRLQ